MKQAYNFPDHVKGDTFNGITFTVTLNSIALPLTGATIKMQLRKLITDPVALELSTINNKIQITNAPGGVFAIMPQIIDIATQNYIYDIEITLQDGTIKTYISGKWKIISDVTHG
jgi:hypothetical protein